MASTVRIFRLTSRLGRKSLLFQVSSQHLVKQFCAPLSTSCLKNADRKLIPDEGFWTKNKRMDRPMSPHVTIYSFPLPALMSISHRFTGLGWSFGIAAIGVGALVLPGDSATYLDAIKAMDLPVWLLGAGKMILVWPLTYHTLNGIRHLVWDFSRGLQLGPIYKTGAAIIGLSFLTALGIVGYCSC